MAGADADLYIRDPVVGSGDFEAAPSLIRAVPHPVVLQSSEFLRLWNDVVAGIDLDPERRKGNYCAI
jgi:hypothetical protein